MSAVKFCCSVKISKIRDQLSAENGEDNTILTPDPFSGQTFDFSCVTEDDVKKLISRSKAISAQVDPITTRIVLEHLDVLLPVVTNFNNASLKSGVVPQAFKSTTIKPLLK